MKHDVIAQKKTAETVSRISPIRSDSFPVSPVLVFQQPLPLLTGRLTTAAFPKKCCPAKPKYCGFSPAPQLYSRTYRMQSDGNSPLRWDRIRIPVCPPRWHAPEDNQRTTRKSFYPASLARYTVHLRRRIRYNRHRAARP